MLLFFTLFRAQADTRSRTHAFTQNEALKILLIGFVVVDAEGGRKKREGLRRGSRRKEGGREEREGTGFIPFCPRFYLS